MQKAITLILFLFSLFGIAQNEPNDCVNSITICGNENFVSGATGSGNVQEVAACGGFEHNSLWLKINIAQSGTLGFNLVPSNPAISVDYDFWIYGPNVNCTALGSPIRCCTTNPLLAGLTSNVTGMIGTTLVTQSGPGANGNGFVRWLDVVVGQSYYIVIDRPVGDGGFEIQWTGTAMSGTGAFPIPPLANSISDYKVCSNVPNIGIFDLNIVRSSINSDLVDNEISFYTTFANAFDGVNELPNIISNTSNPQTIYAKVKNYTTDCYTITSFNLVVNPVPTVTISASNTNLCNGESVTISFLGSPNSLVEYTINGGTTQQAILDSAGAFSFSQTPTSNTVYQLLNIKSLDSSNNVICTSVYNTSINVSVLPLPTASISGTTTICSGDNATVNFNGTPNAIVTYTINSGSNQTITLDSSGNASINLTALSATVTYTLVHVSYPTVPNCTTTLSGNAIITVNPILNATISGTSTICSGSSATINFSGTPNAIVTFNDGSSNIITNLDASGNGTFTTPALTSNTTYTLISVEMAGSLTCFQLISGSATISISTTPTASILGSTSICEGNSTIISFSGTPNSTVSYTVNSVSQTIPLDASGNASLTTPILTTTTTYSLVSVSLSGTQVCSQNITGSAVVTVNPLPNVTISGTTSICNGTSTTINFVGTPNAIVSYNINGGSTLTLTLNALGNFSITTPNLISNTTYSLISVLSNSIIPSCSKNVSGDAIISIIPSLTASISGTSTICSGSSATINFSGTPNTIVTFNDGSSNIITNLDASGNGTFTTPALTSNTTYTLISVEMAGSLTCFQLISGSATISISSAPTASILGSTSICEGNSTIISFSGTPNTTVSYTVNSVSQTIPLDASGNATLTTPILTTTTTYSLVSVSLSGTQVCSQNITGSAVVTVDTSPSFTLNDGVICLDQAGNPIESYTFSTGLSDITYDFEWYFQGNLIPLQNQSSLIASQPGVYTVIVTNSITGCILNTVTTNLVASIPAQTIQLYHSLAFSDSPFVEVIVNGGNGTYQFQLDNGPIQLSNTFSNILFGEHTIRVTDILGCTNLSSNFTIIGYPKFFTPNGDGYNDTWNINGLENNNNSIITIFDRFSNFIKQIKPNSVGWDGTLNGQLLLSTDYWFSVDYVENGQNKIFKSHFSLKR